MVGKVRTRNGLPGRRYGWRPDVPDHRDLRFAVRRRAALPPVVSLRSKLLAALAIQDQGELGSCTAHAAAAAMAFLHRGLDLSRLKLYYDERVLDGTVNEDAGAYIRDSVKVLNQTGAAAESYWPYVPAKFAKKPPARAARSALRHKISKYMRVAPSDYRACLAAGFPFIIGFSVYESFEGDATANTGRVFVPKKSEALLGGHAVCVIGYAPRWGEVHYEVRNSWSAGWGDAGHFWIPARYLEDLNLADDAWTVRA